MQSCLSSIAVKNFIRFSLPTASSCAHPPTLLFFSLRLWLVGQSQPPVLFLTSAARMWFPKPTRTSGSARSPPACACSYWFTEPRSQRRLSASNSASFFQEQFSVTGQGFPRKLYRGTYSFAHVCGWWVLSHTSITLILSCPSPPILRRNSTGAEEQKGPFSKQELHLVFSLSIPFWEGFTEEKSVPTCYMG